MGQVKKLRGKKKMFFPVPWKGLWALSSTWGWAFLLLTFGQAQTTGSRSLEDILANSSYKRKFFFYLPSGTQIQYSPCEFTLENAENYTSKLQVGNRKINVTKLQPWSDKRNPCKLEADFFWRMEESKTQMAEIPHDCRDAKSESRHWDTVYPTLKLVFILSKLWISLTVTYWKITFWTGWREIPIS